VRDAYTFHNSRYLRFRPSYPAGLFVWLASVVSSHQKAWDCGTGSGQSAVGLADHFNRVVATDVNKDQLDYAIEHPKVLYALGSAEESPLPTRSVDLVTASCAVHWFDREAFFQEVKRVLRPGGVIAVWTYTWPHVGIHAVDKILEYYRKDILGPFLGEEFHIHYHRYRNLSFPFDEMAAPGFHLQCNWNADGLLDFLSTWSAAQLYLHETGLDSTRTVRNDLAAAWEEHAVRDRVELPLYFRVGRVEP